jgi:hypothetical protein
VLLGAAVLAAIAALPMAVRAEPMTRTCPSGALCVVFYSSPDLAGNSDARDIGDAATCIELGSLAGSVRNDSSRPVALYSDYHCSAKAGVAVVAAGAPRRDFPAPVHSFASVFCQGDSLFCLFSEPGFAGVLEVEGANAPAQCRALNGPALSARNLSTTGRTLSLYSGTACTAADLVTTLAPGKESSKLDRPATHFSS